MKLFIDKTQNVRLCMKLKMIGQGFSIVTLEEIH